MVRPLPPYAPSTAAKASPWEPTGIPNLFRRQPSGGRLRPNPGRRQAAMEELGMERRAIPDNSVRLARIRVRAQTRQHRIAIERPAGERFFRLRGRIPGSWCWCERDLKRNTAWPLESGFAVRFFSARIFAHRAFWAAAMAARAAPLIFRGFFVGAPFVTAAALAEPGLCSGRRGNGVGEESDELDLEGFDLGEDFGGACEDFGSWDHDC